MAALTVLGVGNVLMQDEGVGVRVMEALRESRTWPASVEFIDGGAGGLGLLNVIEQADAMLIIDAADMGLPPGSHRMATLAQLAGNDPAGRVSMHDVPLTETLRLCQQFSRRPEMIRLLLIQPAVVDFGRGLTVAVRAEFDGITASASRATIAMLGEIEGTRHA